MIQAIKLLGLELLLLIVLIFPADFANSENIIFSERGSLADKLYKNEKFSLLNRRIIECQTGEFVYNHEVLEGIYEPSYHNILGKIGKSCLYNSNYSCNSKKCFASCELSQKTIELLNRRFKNYIILSVKKQLDKDDILIGSSLDAEISEAFKNECKIVIK